MNHPESSTSPGRRLVGALAAAVSLLVALDAGALTRGESAAGRPFVEGGVGASETESMESERVNYSLWVMTAARTSGAHLADAQITIVNDKGERVFERRLDGPWLMIDLPLGRYEVHARMGEQAQSRITTIHPGDHHQIVFYFDVEGGVLPKP
jgi:hypothetical protein